MGVKSLSTFLRYNADKIGRVIERPPLSGVASAMTPRRNIIVDSHGFLMTFATEVMHRSTAQAIAVGDEPFPYAALAGGDLQCIRSAMIFMITRLRHVYGVELVFAVDAPVGIVQHDAINRGAVVAERGAERDALLVKQLETCANVALREEAADVVPTAVPAAAPAMVTHVPLAADRLLRQNNRPQMLVEQLYETLFQLNVTVKHLDDEVDRYIGALVHDYDPICVFTGDSDFVVIPGIPVVMDFDYPWDVMLHGWDASVRYSTMTGDALRSCIVDASRAVDEPLCLFLLESANLASFLSIDQDELLLAMSLCGNEITEKVINKILEITPAVVKEIGSTQAKGRGFRNYVLHAAALAKEIVKHSVAPDDETQGLLSHVRYGVKRGTLNGTLRYLKKLLKKVIAAPQDPAARIIDTSAPKWKQAQNIFGPEWFTDWFLTHVRGEEINIPGKSRQIVIWKDLPPADIPAQKMAKKKTKKVAKTAATGEPANGTVDDVSAAASSLDPPTRADEVPSEVAATEQTAMSQCHDELVADLISGCTAVVHALGALASVSAGFIAILQYTSKCADDDMDRNSNSTGNDSTDSNVDVDPFLKSLAPFVPCKILLSIQQYKLSSRQNPYTPLQFVEHPEERVLYDHLTSQRLPSFFLLIARTGRCNDHAIPIIAGQFGFSLDLFTFYRLRQVIAHRLGRDTIRVRNHRAGIIKPREQQLSDDWLTATTAAVVPRADGASDQQTYREVTVSLPASVTDAVANSNGDVATLISELFYSRQDILQWVTPPLSSEGDGGPPFAVLLVMWVVHAGCTSFDEVRRLAEMMVLMHYSENGNEEMANAARRAVRGIARVNHEHSFRDPPIGRTVELSRLFTVAFLEVKHLLKLLGIDNVMHLPEPADVFSGTLLHDLMALEAPLRLETLVDSATLSPAAHHTPLTPPPTSLSNTMGHIMSTIIALCNRFQSGFRALQYRRADHYETVKAAPPLRMEAPDEEMDSLESGGRGTQHLPAAAIPSATPPLLDANPSTRTKILPIEQQIPELLRQVAGNRVVFVEGGTGSGKSSMVPLYLHRDAVAQGRCSYIICTQPRRVAAIALAKRVAYLLGEEVGQTVGYRIGGGTKKESHGKTKILFVTTGYLLESLSHEHHAGLWSRATHIVLDEVHERSLECDMMMLVVRLLLQQEDDEGIVRQRAKKLILMSATISMTLFQNYFSSLSYPTISSWRAASASASGSLLPSEIPIVSAGVRPKAVTTALLPDIIKDVVDRIPDFPKDALSILNAYVTRADRAKSASALQLSPKEVKSMCRLILTFAQPASCILVFLPGLKEIEDFFHCIADLRHNSVSLSLRLLALHSIVPQEEQNLIFDPAADNECKIILSTNIAETSITIEDVKVVVDLGFVRRVVYDANKDAKTISTQWCSRAASAQRMGRAGRVADGTVLRFYTKRTYDKVMPEFDKSVLFPLEASILKFRLQFAHFGDIHELLDQLIEPPAEKNVSNTLSRLIRLGALGPAPEYKVLNFGRIAADLPVDIKLSRAIVLASRYGLAGEMAVIAAGHMLTFSPYQLPRRSACNDDAQFQTWIMRTFTSMHHFDGGRCNDPLQFLSLMEEALAERGEQCLRTFCNRNKLEYRQIAALIEATRLICTRIRDSTVVLNFTADDKDLIDAICNPVNKQEVKFASLDPQSRAFEHLLLVLTACADSVLGGVLATPSMHETLADPKHFLTNDNRNTALSWTQSRNDDVILFPEITKEVFDAGEATFLECLRCFGASAVVFLAKRHAFHGAAVRMPRPMRRSAALKTTAGVNAICRMNKLHIDQKWSFSSQSGKVQLVHDPATSNTVDVWRSFKLAADSLQEDQVPPEQSDSDSCASEVGEEQVWSENEDDNEDDAESEADEGVKEEIVDGRGDAVIPPDTNPPVESFHWKHRVRVDKWSSVGSYFVGRPSSSPALLGVAFTLNYLGNVPIATCSFLFPTQGSQKVLSFLAALVHLPPTWTVTLAKGRDKSGIAITKLFTNDVQIDDVLRLLTPPISPISLLELNLHRLALNMLTNAFTRSPEDYKHLLDARHLLRTLREEGEKMFVAMAARQDPKDPDHCRGNDDQWDVELTSQIFGTPPQVESGHDVLTFVDIDPLVVDPTLAACSRWQHALQAYRGCMHMVEAEAEDVSAAIPQLPQSDYSVASQSDDEAVVVASPAATTIPLQPSTSVAPREFRLGAHVIPIAELIRNKFVEDCIQNGTNVGSLCKTYRSHSRMTCRFAHYDRYDMMDGGTVCGSDLLDNVALQNLRGNTHFKGRFCPKRHCPDPMKCPFLHRK